MVTFLAVLEECGTRHFKCENGECIDKENKCDFRDDCVDGSDEFDEVCGKKIVYCCNI